MKTMKYICVCLLIVQIFITPELTYAGELGQEVTDTVTEKDKTLSMHESENTNNQLEITLEESETTCNNVDAQDNKQNSIYYQKKSNTEGALMLNEQEFDVSNSEKKVQSLTGIGSLGTSNWYIDSFGTLHIESGVFPDSVAMNNNNSPFYTYQSQIESIIFEGPVIAGASLSWLFSGLDQVKSINNLSYLDTSQTTDMSRMFHGMRSLELLDLLDLNTENVTNMFMMFADMKNLTSINVSSFNTEKVTNMNNMFQNTSKLKSLNLSSFYTDNLLSMDFMFMWSGLNELDISNFDTTNSTLNRDTFYGVPLKKIKLSKNFLFKESLLNSPASSENYTGKWQNIGHGTESNPLGNNVWTSEELQINYDGTVGVDTYVWQPVRYKAKDLAVNYQDAEGNKIADSQIVSGNIGDTYDVSGEEYKLKIAGYTFQEVKGEVTGILTDKEQSVTYIYTKNPVKAKDLTVNYQDVEGNKVADSQIVSGNIGDSYDVSGEEYKLEITGYTFKEVKGEVTGALTDKEQTVTYIYTKNPVKAKDLTVNYQDAEGNKIADSQIVSGNIGDSYDVSGEEYKLEIAGYTFKEVKGEVTGILTDKEQSVTYVYTKNPVKAKDLTVNYQDAEGNKIADSQTVSGNIGDSYDVSKEEYKLEIAGYTFKEVKGEVTGILTDKEQSVTYVYTKNPVKAKDLTVNYQDAEGNKIADSQIVSGNIGDSYDVSGEEYKLEIAGYTFKEVKGEVTGILTDKEQSVTYVYTKNPVKAKDLTVNYQDAEGNKIADSQTVSGNIGDSYDVSKEEYKLEIAGYTFKEVKGEVTGGLTDKEQTVTYIYISEATKVKNKETSYSTEEKNEDQVQGSGNKYNTRKATLLPKTGEKQTFYLSLRGILLFFSGLIVMYWRFKIKE